MAGLLIQGSEQLMYLLKGETKFKDSKRGKMTIGGLVAFIDGNIPFGFKMEKQMAVGKRLVLVGNGGTMRSQGGDTASEANLEARLREADFPIGQNQSHAGLSLTMSKDDLTATANIRSQVSIGRQTKLTGVASLDTKRTGRFSVRASSSDQLQLALMAILPLAMSIYKRIIQSKETDNDL
ncbi:PREDICTED: translocase of chloroplast 159, chloroplastic [Camelina sativa]|uniref:Translocase of chloroplast 159, chloroplastic n=1 Tax=Camelina sativa TaxID=90675 RepID=A0ABM0T8Q6_CAMSA|nr:PREDICTED: translocase of chloroplast 159, chloroplastic [Camelina sativa]